MNDSEFCVGDMSVIKVHELDLNGFAATQLLPGLDPMVVTKHPDWIDSRTYDLQTGHVLMSVHTWVVRFEGKIILIDTGAGNDKNRPTLKVLDHLHNPYLDSMMPLEAEERIRRVRVDGGEVLKGIRFLSTPGHSIDHSAISITSQGFEAIFGGDVMHHPLELYEPDLVSVFCEFPEGARRSRRWLARHAAERNAVYFSSHFPSTSVGRIIQTGENFGWEFVD
jgi:hypothetical protein